MNIDFQLVEGSQARLIDPQKIEWPDETAVLYAIEDGEIVGSTALLEIGHLEGTWVAESKRGSSLGLRLVKKMESLIAETGRSHVFAYAYDQQPEVADYLQRIGYEKFPVTVWVKNLKETT